MGRYLEDNPSNRVTGVSSAIYEWDKPLNGDLLIRVINHLPSGMILEAIIILGLVDIYTILEILFGI